MMALLRRLLAVILGSAVVAKCIRAGLGRRSRAAPTASAPPTRPTPAPIRVVPDARPEATATAEPEPEAAPEPEASTEPDATAEPEPVGEPVAAWCEPVDGACPPGYPIKVKVSSGIFHEPGGAHHPRVRPDRCYTNASAAEADGFRRSKT